MEESQGAFAMNKEKVASDLKLDNGPKVFTSYFGNAKKLEVDENVQMVSIAQFQPRFVASAKLKKYGKLAPTAAMLSGLKTQTMSLADFDEKYEQILSQLDPKQVWADLLALGAGKHVVIMCYEKPSDTCHRHAVSAWMRKNGIEVLEYPYGAPKMTIGMKF